MAKKNVVDQHQFKGGYIPQQPADGSNRVYKKEPNKPSQASQKKRMGVQIGSMSQAMPGLAALRSQKPKKRG